MSGSRTSRRQSSPERNSDGEGDEASREQTLSGNAGSAQSNSAGTSAEARPSEKPPPLEELDASDSDDDDYEDDNGGASDEDEEEPSDEDDDDEEADGDEHDFHLFCHKCQDERSRPDRVLVCPVCGDDFVEEITDDSDVRDLYGGEDEEDEDHEDGMGMEDAPPGAAALPNLLQQFLTQAFGPNAQFSITTTAGAPNAPGQQHTFTISNNGAAPFQPQGPQAGQGMPGGAIPLGPNPLSTLLGEALGLQQGQPFTPATFMDRLLGSMGMVGNPGDYAFGREFDDIVSRLMEQSGKAAPPPAPEDTIKNLPRIKVDKEASEGQPCSICQDPFELGSAVPQLPCGHIFHEDCNENWLKVNGTCPVCRHSLVEQQEGEASNGSSSSSSA